jgi:hypothetical protein
MIKPVSRPSPDIERAIRVFGHGFCFLRSQGSRLAVLMAGYTGSLLYLSLAARESALSLHTNQRNKL